jgi:hypothetical protein
MDHTDKFQYKNTFTSNFNTLSKKFTGQDIIHSVQYLSDEDVNIDSDGADSNWVQCFLFIVKEDTDYVFHLFEQQFHNSSFPYFSNLDDYYESSYKLSSTMSKIKTYVDNMNAFTTSEVHNFVWKLNDFIFNINTDNKKFNAKLKVLKSRFYKLERLNNKRLDNERKKREREHIKFIKSKEYKEYLEMKECDEKEEQHQKNEEERLKLLISMYGEENGRLFHARL